VSGSAATRIRHHRVAWLARNGGFNLEAGNQENIDHVGGPGATGVPTTPRKCRISLTKWGERPSALSTSKINLCFTTRAENVDVDRQDKAVLAALRARLHGALAGSRAPSVDPLVPQTADRCVGKFAVDCARSSRRVGPTFRTQRRKIRLSRQVASRLLSSRLGGLRSPVPDDPITSRRLSARSDRWHILCREPASCVASPHPS
jgi:hypothetical protein